MTKTFLVRGRTQFDAVMKFIVATGSTRNKYVEDNYRPTDETQEVNILSLGGAISCGPASSVTSALPGTGWGQVIDLRPCSPVTVTPAPEPAPRDFYTRVIGKQRTLVTTIGTFGRCMDGSVTFAPVKSGLSLQVLREVDPVARLLAGE